MAYLGTKTGSKPWDVYDKVEVIAQNAELVAATDTKTNTSIPMSTQLKGDYSLSNTIKTLNFDAVTYTGNGTSQDIVTGISSVDFTASGNGSGYWLDRTVNQVKNDAGVVVDSGSCVVNTSKVHIKSRSLAASNYVWDSLRGKDVVLHTDTTAADETGYAALFGFSSTGFSVGNFSQNTNLATYIAYQTLYTHIKWGVTSQGKFQIEAYNPVTNEGMIYYLGSGVDGHQISHSQGVEIDYFDIKNLSDGIKNWITNSTYLTDSKVMVLNLTIAEASDGAFSESSSSALLLCVGVNSSAINSLNQEHIMYYKAKSETCTIGTYNGTGVAGNFVETLDVNGVARRPARIITKRVNDISDWVVLDNKRGFGSSVAYIKL